MGSSGECVGMSDFNLPLIHQLPGLNVINEDILHYIVIKHYNTIICTLHLHMAAMLGDIRVMTPLFIMLWLS